MPLLAVADQTHQWFVFITSAENAHFNPSPSRREGSALRFSLQVVDAVCMLRFFGAD